jgi:hypothetical protein
MGENEDRALVHLAKFRNYSVEIFTITSGLSANSKNVRQKRSSTVPFIGTNLFKSEREVRSDYGVRIGVCGIKASLLAQEAFDLYLFTEFVSRAQGGPVFVKR